IDLGAGLVIGAAGNNFTTGSLPGNVLNNGTLFFDRDTWTYAGIISGDGAIVQQGAAGSAITNLTGFSAAFSGAVDILQGGTLRVNNRLGDGTITVTVEDGGTLGGSGVIGGNVDVLAGGHIAAGNSPGTILITGNLTLNTASNSDFELNTNGIVGSTQNDWLIVNGDVTLAGALNVLTSPSSGYYRLMDYNGTLTGAYDTITGVSGYDIVEALTNIDHQVNLRLLASGQQMQFWDGTDTTGLMFFGVPGTAGAQGGTGTWLGTSTNWTDTVLGQINDQWRGSVAVFAGAAGTVTVGGGVDAPTFDTLQFTTTGYVLQDGALSIGVAGANVGNNALTGSIINVTNVDATIGSVIQDGAGKRLNVVGGGNLILTGDNTYSGGTQIESAMVQLGDGGTSGSILGNVLDNGVLAFNRSDDVSFGGAVSGSGEVRQIGAGSTTLADGNTYAGGTQISAGTLIGSATSFGTGPIADNAALIIKQAANADFANVISGTGSFNKTGAGVLNLTSDSSGLTGATALEQGGLKVNGSLAGSFVTALSGTVLSGSGTVGGVWLNSGATISPGNSPGTMTVVGNYTQTAGSTYLVEIVPGSTVSDLIDVGGAATIDNGSVLQVSRLGPASAMSLGDQYTVLSAAGGVTGTYTLTGQTQITLYYSLVDKYDANNVYLVVQQDIPLDAGCANPNGCAVSSGLPPDSGPGSAVAKSPDADTASDALNQLSGEIHASAITALMEDSRFVREATNDRLGNAAHEMGNDNNVWMRAFGSWGSWDSDGNAASLDRTIGGVFIGADGQPGENSRLGALVGYSHTSFDVSARNSSGTSDNYTAGIYGGKTWDALALRAGAAYTKHDISIRRNVAFNGFYDSLKSDYNARTAQAYGELGYSIPQDDVTVEPFASIAYVNLRADGFREKGGEAALKGKGSTTDITFATLGLHFSGEAFENANYRGTLGWRHAFGDVTPDKTMQFLIGGNPFKISGVPIARDNASLEAGLDFALSKDAMLSVTYNGQFGRSIFDHGARATLEIKF
ncbi:MAG: autotransporter domain-containing protein, partial [Methylobacillus sp.]|nr:autotransporter domain-containing protein [Methylobacillus sp.]